MKESTYRLLAILALIGAMITLRVASDPDSGPIMGLGFGVLTGLLAVVTIRCTIEAAARYAIQAMFDAAKEQIEKEKDAGR